MVRTITGASSTSPLTWNTIQWSQVSNEVKQLQMRIAKAVFLGVLIFTGLIAYDTQKLKSLYYQGADSNGKIGIMAAFTLYLDFINLFIYLLRFFGNKRND